MRFAAFFVAVSTCLAQPVLSPEISSGGMVTFRLKAPKAQEVTVRGDWMTGTSGEKMTRDDNGIWSFTAGPLEPNIHAYWFYVDGVMLPDPRNPKIKTEAYSGPVSVVEIPGPGKAYQELRETPHGVIHVHTYFAQSVGTHLRMHVYTPPAYVASSAARYPVLYLLHGSGENDGEWSGLGRAGLIADNLIAQGKALPMIIVMPEGHAGMPSGTPSTERDKRMESILLDDIIPLIEKSYRASPTRNDRAMAGLSMGGAQTLDIGLAHLDMFSSLGVFSAGARAGFAPPANANEKLKLFWIACGKSDQGAQPGTKRLIEALDLAHVKYTYRESEGGHTWWNWRLYLSEFLPLLFR